MSKTILIASCLVAFLSATAVQAKTIIIKKGHDHHMMHHPMHPMMHHDMHH